MGDGKDSAKRIAKMAKINTFNKKTFLVYFCWFFLHIWRSRHTTQRKTLFHTLGLQRSFGPLKKRGQSNLRTHNMKMCYVLFYSKKRPNDMIRENIVCSIRKDGVCSISLFYNWGSSLFYKVQFVLQKREQVKFVLHENLGHRTNLTL